MDEIGRDEGDVGEGGGDVAVGEEGGRGGEEETPCSGGGEGGRGGRGRGRRILGRLGEPHVFCCAVWNTRVTQKALR